MSQAVTFQPPHSPARLLDLHCPLQMQECAHTPLHTTPLYLGWPYNLPLPVCNYSRRNAEHTPEIPVCAHAHTSSPSAYQNPLSISEHLCPRCQL